LIDRSIYGAVFFDDETRPQAGWASVKGETAFRIRGTGDLASDVYWWTNLPSTTFFKYGALGNQKLKHNSYLKPTMSQLHQELGLITVRMSAARIAEVSSEIFTRVMRMAYQSYGLNKPVEITLTDDLYDLLIREDRPITPEIDEALRQSYQTWSNCENKTPDKSKIITFRRPRIQHALDVLSTPIPGDQWEFIDQKSLPPESKRVDWIVSQPRPALVRASVKNVQFEFSRIVSFGAGALIDRSWMSHPELLMLSKFANVKIDSVFLSNGYEPQNVYRKMVTNGSLGLLSISNGILAENYWIALASSKSYKKHYKDKVTIHSPRSVWLTASDRFHSILPALMMDGSGFSVRGFGRGKVMIAIQRGALKDARACAAAAGLNAPLHVHEDISVQSSLAS
jgi:hypothetical protein